MSRVVRFDQTGGSDVLKVEDVHPASPGNGEVRLKVQDLGLNPPECLLRAGMCLEAGQLPPRIGYEATGVVDAHPESGDRARQWVYDRVQAGKLEPILDARRFALDPIVDAHRYMEGSGQFGKTVVDV